jgi:hypothetical protein
MELLVSIFVKMAKFMLMEIAFALITLNGMDLIVLIALVARSGAHYPELVPVLCIKFGMDNSVWHVLMGKFMILISRLVYV